LISCNINHLDVIIWLIPEKTNYYFEGVLSIPALFSYFCLQNNSMIETRMNEINLKEQEELSFDSFRSLIINDYKIAFESRQASLLGRKEVLTGKAKFGIFGDGKEVAQLAMAKVFLAGDWRSGYYRDQTFMLAAGMLTMPEFFAQLYANTDSDADPGSGGRQMNCHFASRLLNEDGSWMDLTSIKNSSADISPTGGQMGRLVGLALASKLYKNNQDLAYLKNFSLNGNEVAFGTIGNASTSEGIFFEAINAAGVLQVPMVISIWDDAYGISVPAEYQTTKEDISEILKGFQRDEKGEGYEIFKVRGWDYPGLCETYEKAIKICREQHIPVMIHVTEMTQPQGHSTSGSHERYKNKDRIAWENEFDCMLQMRKWMIESAISNEDELNEIEANAKIYIRNCQKKAWADFNAGIKSELDTAIKLVEGTQKPELIHLASQLKSSVDPSRKDVIAMVRNAIRLLRHDHSESKKLILDWYSQQHDQIFDRYNSKLFTGSSDSPLNINSIKPEYSDASKLVDGREILNACFDANFTRDPRVLAFGEDVGAIGDVNQGFAGLQAKFGKNRITDTGIREMTIVGQGIGLAMRGLRPIAEIQYLDYLLFALNILSDDLATLSYRTKGRQKAPLIVRTRGHRLEGIWHSGSPMGVIINSLRGMHVCVPRNMTQAAGMYNTLLHGDEPALVIECLNGYRLKEKMPENVGEFRVELGKAEILREGRDVTVISYGSTLRIVEEAAEQLEVLGIDIEIVDPQTFLPFDLDQLSVKSLKKTNKLLVVGEDVPGGSSAFILQQVLEHQNGYQFLDGQPHTLTAKPHRTPYGSDGDYFSKPSVDDVVESVYAMMNDNFPKKFPKLF
jgi:pyruvate/2-oxoglutarate/acetoin dehydrogenase E1 component/TPP-dependent pyruvate/acetoin dehydrogenase alpha subunit